MGGLRATLIAVVLLLLAVAPAAAGAEAGPTPSPSCAEGPVTVGETTLGTPCADVIVASPQVATVRGGGGNDTILAGPIAAASAPCPSGCHLGIGSQTFNGGPGDDVVYGERGNDTLNGGEGNDQLFGGIGDDRLSGGPGNDRLSGGFGGDSVDGEAGDDYVRGDGTADTIVDSGGGGVDTLSYSTGVTPGLPNNVAYPDFSDYPGFPAVGAERGVYLNLDADVADNGVSPAGGGVDEAEGADFEKAIGTPFSDFIVGSSAGETIYGGGGGDVILGEGGNDSLRGGADGDHLDGGTGANTLDGGAGNDYCKDPTAGASCEPAQNTGGVVLRDPTKVSVGFMAPEEPGHSQLYLSGSNAIDEVTATYAPGPPATVTFDLGPGSTGSFDQSASADGGCDIPTATQATCTLAKPLDSIVLAGMDGDDDLQAPVFPTLTSVVVAGGEGGDTLAGGALSEDVLADGPDADGDDTLSASGGDDALLNNGGADQLSGGDGNDLFLSNSVCDGDVLTGGLGRDNASWAKYKAGIAARIGVGDTGRPGVGGAPECVGGSLGSLQEIEDLEGTSSADVLYGGPGPNQLLGWAGADTFFSGAGKDTILANSGDSDPPSTAARTSTRR